MSEVRGCYSEERRQATLRRHKQYHQGDYLSLSTQVTRLVRWLTISHLELTTLKCWNATEVGHYSGDSLQGSRVSYVKHFKYPIAKVLHVSEWCL